MYKTALVTLESLNKVTLDQINAAHLVDLVKNGSTKNDRVKKLKVLSIEAVINKEQKLERLNEVFKIYVFLFL